MYLGPQSNHALDVDDFSQLVVMPVPLERSILTNVCLPYLRGRANALVGIFDDLGKGLGPALVSILITTFDRQTAFNISLIGWIVGGALSLAIMMVSVLIATNASRC